MLSPRVWLGLSPEMRRNIATVFHLQRSGGVEVINGTVASDGYTADNLAVITTETLQSLLKTADTDFYKLFDQMVEYLRVNPPKTDNVTIGSIGITLPGPNPAEPVELPKESSPIDRAMEKYKQGTGPVTAGIKNTNQVNK